MDKFDLGLHKIFYRLVHWYNHERLHSTNGYVSPIDAENIYYCSLITSGAMLPDSSKPVSDKTRTVQFVFKISFLNTSLFPIVVVGSERKIPCVREAIVLP